MGNCCIRKDSNSNAGISRNITVAILGLDNAGKTVTAKVLKGEPSHEVVPTIGFTNIQFSFKKHKISMYDLGGGPRIRDIWRNYFAEVHGLIYVLDSSRRERIEECREVLIRVMDDDKIKGKPMLVLGNKQDVRGAMDCSEICDSLRLNVLADSHKSLCRIEGCSALKLEKGKADSAIICGFQWLLDMINLNWPALKARVDEDMADQKEYEKKMKLEREERVRKLREEREKESAEQNESKDKKEEEEEEKIDGDPFKRLDAHWFSNKSKDLGQRQEKSGVQQEKETRAAEVALSGYATEASSDVLNGSSPSDEQMLDTRYPSSAKASHLENGRSPLSQGGLSAVPRNEVGLSEKKASVTMPTILPPLEMDVEHGNRKKRRRRNKRNRVAPSSPDAEKLSAVAMRQYLEPNDRVDRFGSVDDSTSDSCSLVKSSNEISSDTSPVQKLHSVSMPEELSHGDNREDTDSRDNPFADDVPHTSKSFDFPRPNEDLEDITV